ncbi:hypothetical protein BHD05_07985 [Marisediminicola antarctica]|uniref:Uncharacterized protein n=1 Tax=Marisediminicola antarctica TaxID=674079 RepID=A0A7L5AGD7_9MICO|nr:hypothetical protein BHD05_07985 [Marisediminicola antarctica]
MHVLSLGVLPRELTVLEVIQALSFFDRVTHGVLPGLLNPAVVGDLFHHVFHGLTVGISLSAGLLQLRAGGL